MAMKARYTVIDGEVVSELRGGVKYDYVPDPLGSTIALLDSSQTKIDTFEYWPYGESAVRTGATPTPFQFVGSFGYYHDGTSRNYVRARYLDKNRGRWITEDPIGGDSGDYNFYRYVTNNPESLIDRSGNCPSSGFFCSICEYMKLIRSGKYKDTKKACKDAARQCKYLYGPLFPCDDPPPVPICGNVPGGDWLPPPLGKFDRFGDYDCKIACALLGHKTETCVFFCKLWKGLTCQELLRNCLRQVHKPHRDFCMEMWTSMCSYDVGPGDRPGGR
ncbi:MAG: RHS repeat-associated core domain-containing protein [Armatimonas sp.]